MNKKPDYYIIVPDKYGCGVDVKSVTHNGYEAHSVLAGQDCVRFIETYDCAEDALVAYPGAEYEAVQTERNFFNHLPDGPDLGP